MMNQSSNDHPHWDSFWARDHVNTFGQGNKNYEGFFEEFWDEHFKTLAPQSKILDVASGNGAIALLAESVGRKLDKQFIISACDIARIGSRREGSDISFHGGIDIAKTGFDSSQYQLITSQYGFEYCEREAGLAEIYRLLQPNGEFIAFTHHEQSGLVQSAGRICAFLSGPVKTDDPLGLAQDLVKAMGEVRDRHDQQRLQFNKKADKRRKKLERQIDKYKAAYGATVDASALLDYINPLFNQGMFRPLKDKLAYLKDCRKEMQHDLSRQLDLVNAALNDETAALLLKQAESLGMSCLGHEVVRLRGGEILGRVIHLKKAKASDTSSDPSDSSSS